MAQVTTKHILNKVEELKLPFYVVYELDGKTRLDHNITDTEANPTKTAGELEKFFSETEGTVVVQLQPHASMQGKNANEMLKFQVRLSGNTPTNQYVNGANGVDVERLMNLQAENFRAQLEHQADQHKRDLEIMEIRRELKEQKEGSFLDKHGDKIAGLLPYLLNHLTPGAAAPIINGLPETEPGTAMQLLNRLAAVDPQYLEHLEQLCILAEQNPTMYNQGVSMIKSFITPQPPTPENGN